MEFQVKGFSRQIRKKERLRILSAGSPKKPMTDQGRFKESRHKRYRNGLQREKGIFSLFELREWTTVAPCTLRNKGDVLLAPTLAGQVQNEQSDS